LTDLTRPRASGGSAGLRRTAQRRRQHAEDREKRLEQYVRAARAGGTSWQGIAAELGVSRQAAWARFHQRVSAHPDSRVAGLSRAPSNRSVPLTQKAEQQVAQARAAGATWQSIADELGVTRQAAWARYHSLSPAGPQNVPSPHAVELTAIVAQWRQNHVGWREIGNRLNRSHQAVWSRFAKISLAEDLRIPEAVLDVSGENPVRFEKRIKELDQSDPHIHDWLRRPNAQLGMATGHGRPVAPLTLLGKPGLREFLLTAWANHRV
jgi:biotin operon repressor